MKKFKKTISLLIATILFSVTLSNAHAQTVEAKEIALDAARSALNGMAYMIGRVMGEEALKTVSSSGFFDDVLLSLCDSGDITENDNNTITFSEEAIVQLSSLLDEYFSQEENLPEVVWVYVPSVDEYKASKFYSTTQYYQFRSLMDSSTFAWVMPWHYGRINGSYVNHFMFIDLTGKNLVINGNKFSTEFVNFVNTVNSCVRDTHTPIGTSYTFDWYNSNGTCCATGDLSKLFYTDAGLQLTYTTCPNEPVCLDYTYSVNVSYSQGNLVRGADTNFAYVPIFESKNAYLNWVTGFSDYYRVQSSYTGGDITVNPNTDYSVVYNNISQTIQNSYAEGKDYTDILSDMQQSYESTMQEISESLGNIEDNTEESNSWLEKIYGKVSNIDNMIAQQFDDLVSTISNGFDSVIDSLTDISLGIGDIDSGDSGSSGGDSESTHKSFWTRLGEFCSSLITGIFSLIETVFMKAIDGLLYLANIVVDNASVALNGITEYMERYIDYFGEDTFLTNLGEALPQQIKDLIVFIVFGITTAGVIYMIKR